MSPLAISNKTLNTPDGFAFQIEFFKIRKSSFYQMELIVDFNSPIDFIVNKESGFDKFAKSIKLAEELQTGNRDFDDLYYISSNNDEAIKEVFKNKNLVELLNCFFKNSAVQISCDEKCLCATWSNLDSPEIEKIFPNAEKNEKLLELVRNFYKIKEYILDTTKSISSKLFIKKSKSFSLKKSIFFTALFFITSIALVIIGHSYYFINDSSDFMSASIKLAISIFVFSAIAIYFLTRGTSKAHTNFLAMIIFFFIGSFFASFGGIQVVNGLNDKSDAIIRKALVVNKYQVKRRKKSTKYYLTFYSWSDANTTDRLAVSYEEFNDAIVGKTNIFIETKSGSLGYEWIKRKWLQ